MGRVILDTSALIAYVNGEPGGDKVPVMSGEAAISTVNYSEAIAVMTRHGWSRNEVREQLTSIVLSVVAFDLGTAEAAGLLIALTQPYGLSFGDRACLAAAMREGIPVMTAERAWGKMDLGIDIQLIR